MAGFRISHSVLVGSIAIGLATAQEPWTGNYHSYQAVVVTGGIDWSAAKTQAESMGGHLASVNSAGENDFIFSLIDHPSSWTLGPGGAAFGPWIGGNQPAGVEPGGWRWTTTEPFTFTDWAAGEPDQAGGLQEDFVHYYQAGLGRGKTWNDLSDNGTSGSRPKAFVVEYELATVTIQVNLLNYIPSPAGRAVQVDLIQNGNVAGTANLTLAAGGFGTFTTTVLGPTEIAPKASHWLRKRLLPVNLVGAQTSDVQVTLTNGDVNNDNEVSIGDYALLSQAYNSFPDQGNWNAEADLNGDDEVSIGDYAILSQNFGQFGD